MVGKKGHFDGGKHKAGTHTTVIAEAKQVIDKLTSKDCPCQTLRISPGTIRQAQPGKMRVKVDFHKVGEIIVGLKVTVRGTRGVQDLRVVNSSKLEQVKVFLEREFQTA